ncbi:hypothetical protein ACFVZH_21215 [Streptomyces sp. NPDC059534]|uniref:hypothetical protein n=1 Tax=Streptomyces sp. NPDC059534 TaxID=3346859 RepID=UPI0036CE9A55
MNEDYGYPPPMGHPTRPQQRVTFRPLRNGLDYLDDVVDRLTPPADGGPIADRNLKYAILHLQAGVEVLLKARLEREHWTLVVLDALPKKQGSLGVTRTQFEGGRFKTIGLPETLDRLKQVADIDLEGHRQALVELSETRNALQHYGLDQTAEAIQGQAAQVLGFLLWFINEHLHDDLDAEDRRTVASVRSRLSALTVFVAKRMAALAGELGPLASSIVSCPNCQQPALVTGRSQITCRFCFAPWGEPEHAALRYVARQSAGSGLVGPTLCPRCGFDAVVLDIATAAEPDGRSALCFGCGCGIDVSECAGGCGKRLLFIAEAEAGTRCSACPPSVETVAVEHAAEG